MLYLLPIFLFGTIIGSFLNVVILRYNTGKNIFGPKERSMCFSCGKKLEWYELVPVVSFLVLRGRCSGCKSPISWQYPLVETATGLLFVAIFAKNLPLILTVIFLAIWSLLIVITVYDLRHKIIPDGLVYAFCILALVTSLPVLSGGVMVGGVLGDGFANHLLAGLVFFTFFAGLWLISGGRWLGFGDAKLVLGVGFLLGIGRGLSALALSFWIGAVVSIVLMVVGQLAARLSSQQTAQKAVPPGGLQSHLANLTMKSEIPFAPFIILGTLIAFFWSVDIFGLGGLLSGFLF